MRPMSRRERGIRLEVEPRIPAICPICGADLGAVSALGFAITKINTHIDSEHPGYCYCGDPLEGHKKCVACGSYIGPNHLEHEWKTREQKTLCRHCVVLFDQDPARIRQQMIFGTGSVAWSEKIKAGVRTSKQAQR